MQRFKVAKHADDRPALFEQPDGSSPLVKRLVPGQLVEMPDQAENEEGWIEVEHLPSPSGPDRVAGWLERRFLGQPVELLSQPADPRRIVRQCARIELQTAAGASPGSPSILADYLVALGLIETGLDRVEPMLPGSDAVGPFQIESAEWDEFVAANAFFGPGDRFRPTAQPRCLAFLTQRDWLAFAEREKPGGAHAPDGPFVPSFLNLLHARLLGVDAAHAVFRAVEEGRTAGAMADLLRETLGDGAGGTIDRRARFLDEGGTSRSVGAFDEATRAALTEALAKAFALLREHFPAFAAPTGNAPWMAHAERELKAWEDGGWREDAGPGRQSVVDRYFRATEHHPATPEPWCGAFVAWCLKQAGETPVRGAARAANWTGWGGVEIRDRANIPRGAVVVLGKTPDSGGSGHVTFFNGFDGGRIIGLGGNQGDRVKLSAYDPSRVVAVRWPETPPAAEEDVTTLARTLWGEARGEGRDGMEAVAAVIVNRRNSDRYPGGFAGVCRQPLQFSCWNANDPNREKMLRLPSGDDGTWTTCLEVANRAVAGDLPDPTGGALHYHAADITPAWVTGSPAAKATLRRGRHVFYTGIR